MIDPSGTTPGLPTEPPPKKVVAIACRVENCGSKEAYEVPLPKTGPGVPSDRLYECVKCHSTWGLPVGGHFPY